MSIFSWPMKSAFCTSPTLGPFLFDIHSSTCACSLCGGILSIKPLHFGFNASEDKSWNSWWTFKIGRFYIRWNGFWLEKK